jgi:hypothetical protein
MTWSLVMGEWTIKTPNSICRLFFKIDLLMDFAALCLTYFIDWRYIHSWLVFSTPLVNCCPHGRRNYTCVLLPLYLLSDLPPLPKLNVQYIQIVCVWGGGGLNCAVDHIMQGILHSVSDQIQNLPNYLTTPNKMTSEDYINPLPHCGRPYWPTLLWMQNALKVLKARYSEKLGIPQDVT